MIEQRAGGLPGVHGAVCALGFEKGLEALAQVLASLRELDSVHVHDGRRHRTPAEQRAAAATSEYAQRVFFAALV